MQPRETMPDRTGQNNKRAANAAQLFEWHDCVDDADWHSRQSTLTIDGLVAPAARVSPRFSLHHFMSYWPYALLALALLMGVGGWIWYQAQLGIAQIEADLATSVQSDLWRTPKEAQPPNDSITIAELDAMRPLTSSVTLLSMRGEIAIVRLTMQLGPQEAILRQTRLYQPSENGWQRIAPSAALWGSPRHSQSRYFDFHYYAQDEESVIAAAAILDGLYESLTINFQPPVNEPVSGVAANRSKIQIKVEPGHSYGVIATRTSPTEPFVVASPAIYLSPLTIGEDQLLAQAIMLSLLNESRVEVIQHYHLPPRWQGLVAALHLWQLWQLELPLAKWREPLLSWLVDGLEEPSPQLYRHQPAFTTKLCAIHQLWMPAPGSIHLTLPCSGSTSTDEWQMAEQGSVESPLTLAKLMPSDPGPQQLYPPRPAYPGSEIVMTTLFDYAAATYGKERLMILAQSLHEHTSWQTLVPAVFGVSASDFEKGWRDDFNQRY